jgi:hypothetical protein
MANKVNKEDRRTEMLYAKVTEKMKEEVSEYCQKSNTTISDFMLFLVQKQMKKVRKDAGK